MIFYHTLVRVIDSGKRAFLHFERELGDPGSGEHQLGSSSDSPRLIHLAIITRRRLQRLRNRKRSGRIARARNLTVIFCHGDRSRIIRREIAPIESDIFNNGQKMEMARRTERRERDENERGRGSGRMAAGVSNSMYPRNSR